MTIDDKARQVREALREYEQAHPDAEVEVKTQGRYSPTIRVRIVDPRLDGVPVFERDKEVWRLLDELPADTVQDITMLLMLTPQEKERSITSLDFDNPQPSQL